MSPRVAMSENPHPPTPAAWVPPSPAMRERACAPADGATTMKIGVFWLIAAAVGLALVVLTRLYFTNEYFFFAAYVVLQYVVLSTAWNILGGYTGYINFGTGAFFAIGAYGSVVLHKLPALLKIFDVVVPAIPLPVMILVGGIVSGMVGLGTGYLTLRLRGVFFAIATLALAVVVQTLIVNWDFVGGSRGIYMIRPPKAPIGGSYIQYLYTLMMILCVISVGIARWIERSRLGLGFAAIRDDELAAEAGGCRPGAAAAPPRSRRAPSRGRRHERREYRQRSAARGQRARQALRRVCRAREHRSDDRHRRAGRADRSEWLGQEHAGQLPV